MSGAGGVTKHVMFGCTPGLPSDRGITAVGATWVASRPGGLNIREWLRTPRFSRTSRCSLLSVLLEFVALTLVGLVKRLGYALRICAPLGGVVE